MKPELKKITGYAIAIVLFAVLTLTYFSPLLSGKAIKQGDVSNFKGMSKEIVEHREKYGEEPLWTNSMFSGMPAYQISVLYPNNLVRPLNKVLGIGIPHPAVIVFLSFTGFFLLLLSFGLEIWLSAIFAIAFGLSSYNIIIIEAGHNPKGYAIAYMAPVLASLLITFRGRLLIGAALFALSLSLEIMVNHFQITYYLMLVCIIISIGEVIRLILEKQMAYLFKAFGLLVFSAILAVGPNITNILLTEEYSHYTTRGKSELSANKENKTTGLDKDYATQWSYGIGESFTLLIPNFKGGASSMIGNENEKAMKDVPADFKQYISQMDSYFGDQPFTSGPVYFGAIVCMLFVLSFFVVKDSIKWYMLAVFILSLLLAWGKNYMAVTDFFMDYVPGYNKFRAVSMTLVMAQLITPFMAALALSEIVKQPKFWEKNMKPIYYGTGITAGLCLLFYVAPGMFNDFFKAGEYEELSGQLVKAGFPEDQKNIFLSSLENTRQQIFKADAGRSLIFILLSIAMIWLFIKSKIQKMVLLSVIGVLILIDLWMVDKRYLNKENFISKSEAEEPFEPTSANLEILKDKDPHFRVFNASVSTFNDASTSYFHKSIGGYHGAKFKRYQELWDEHISKNNMSVINMLNTKYVITRPRTNQEQGGEPVAMNNPEACGNAWFVEKINYVNNADEEIKFLEKFNPLQEAVADKKFKGSLGETSAKDSSSTIKLISYMPNRLEYESNNSNNGIAVFSEIFYDKGWNATIDGKEVEHGRVNYVLRGLSVPAGKHKIVFEFKPKTYHTGESIALMSSILLFVFVGTGFFMEYRKKKNAIQKQ